MGITNMLTAAGDALTLVGATVLASSVVYVTVALTTLAFIASAVYVRPWGDAGRSYRIWR